MNKSKIISKFLILGYPIYLRKRISNDQFTFPAHINNFNEVELGTILKYYKKEKYSLFLNTEKRDDLIIELFSIVVFNLLLSKKIKLNHFIDERYFIFPLLSFKKHGYIFNVIDNYLVNEKISNEIIQAIKHNHVNRNKRNYLTKIVSDVFDCYLVKGQEYRSPSNEIINSFIKKVISNDKRFKVNPIKKSYFHELYFDILVEEKLKRRLISEFNSIDNKLTSYNKRNIELREFWIHFHCTIGSEIAKRKPSTNSTSSTP